MRKKRGLSIIERAIITVPTFEKVHQKLYQQVVLRNQSKSNANISIKNFQKPLLST